MADAIGRHVLAGQVIFADDTPVAMPAPGTCKSLTSRLRAYGRLRNLRRDLKPVAAPFFGVQEMDIDSR
ncbi:MAG: hypothetical protein Q8O82_13650, partial [Pseudorhodobacter sp.]|nr:hypothetical protein [Pseudorhodobacter sp.]